MASTATASRIIRFQLNVPETVALKFSDGLERESLIPGVGLQYMYSLDDGRIMFLPPSAKLAIDNAHISAHVPFEITLRYGKRFEVKVLGDTGASMQAPAPSANQMTNRNLQSNPTAQRNLARVLDAPAEEPEWLDTPGQSEASVLLEYAIADAVAATKRSAITFSEESLRAFAITLFIEANRKAARQ